MLPRYSRFPMDGFLCNVENLCDTNLRIDMSQIIFNNSSKKHFIVKIVFLLCCILLSACSYDSDTIFFLGFPIEGRFTSQFSGEPYPPLSSTMRIIFSVTWYALLLGIFATVLLYLTKCFENTSFYSAYKKFWIVGIVLFQALISMLIGITTSNMRFTEALMIYSIFSARP
jgi:hypothetical protein